MVGLSWSILVFHTFLSTLLWLPANPFWFPSVAGLHLYELWAWIARIKENSGWMTKGMVKQGPGSIALADVSRYLGLTQTHTLCGQSRRGGN